MSELHDDKYYISIAIKEANKALLSGDVPVGCVIVKDNKILSKSYNQVEKKGSPLEHAELIAIKKAIKKIGYKHLYGSSIYVTLEPCSLCSGAIVLARISDLIFGAFDPKAGASGSLFNITDDKRLNHRCNVRGGIMENECSALLKDFFAKLRKSKKND